MAGPEPAAWPGPAEQRISVLLGEALRIAEKRVRLLTEWVEKGVLPGGDDEGDCHSKR